ncbi:glycosyltransferase [Echinicola rosea]|uniref:Glycosyl transferase family 1 n=1 Tax=Echinicola rosea TaxID=1807691 RepID=A0ABQ1VCI9_9BACT|nr:glycosyltransferase [Echinicola rosea]GGF51502.1 glycosyl transferase family 1 [Echinicola rosea]
MKKKLVCFTASFPFGSKETFFENELPYLASTFEEVYLFPLYNPSNNSVARNVPSNVKFVSPFVSLNKGKRIIQGVFNVSPIGSYLNDFYTEKVFLSKDKFLRWINSFLNFRTVCTKFSNSIRQYNLTKDETLLYSYWAECPLFTTNLCKEYQKVVRMHGTDFYLPINRGYLPIRQEIYNKSNVLLPISNDIQSILKKDYKIPEEKIHLSRLGISNLEFSWKDFEDKGELNFIRIVSCSRVEKVKRMHLIIEALRMSDSDEQVEWHHFGDGKQFDELQKLVKTLPSHIRVKFHGWSSQKDIYNFYKNNKITWFINVSESEGVPVSIMEAMSFGIPCIATDVGGTSEIVNSNNGHLLPAQFEAAELWREIKNIDLKEHKERRNSAYNTWLNNYEANRNYSNLTKYLSSL